MDALRVHAEADPFHTRILDDLLDELDLDDAALVGVSALQTEWLWHASREPTGGAR